MNEELFLQLKRFITDSTDDAQVRPWQFISVNWHVNMKGTIEITNIVKILLAMQRKGD